MEEVKKKRIRRKWNIFHNNAIERRYFEPFFGRALKLYPKLYFCQDQVKIVSKINGKNIIFRSPTNVEIKDANQLNIIFFIDILVKWRNKFTQVLYNLNDFQMTIYNEIEDKILLVHKQIKDLYNEDSQYCDDAIALGNEAHRLINEIMNRYKEEIYSYQISSPDIYVNASRMHLKFIIDILFNKNGHNVVKIVDVILG